MNNPNLYPYNVFRNKEIIPFVFEPITVFYGNNGSGKSTLLNLIAQKIGAKGYELYSYGQRYIDEFLNDCSYGLGDDEEGRILSLPERMKYIKSEDVLYEIKKIQQEQVLKNGFIYEQVHYKGMTKRVAEQALYDGNRIEIMKFAQEKYSNGETAMQLLFDDLEPESLYLLDEPEVSLAPQNQVKLAEEINKYARFMNCQFVIASHSPFLLGTLNGKIYNLDSQDMEVEKWTELENVRFYYEFFNNKM